MNTRNSLIGGVALAATVCVSLPQAWAGDLSDRFDVHGYGHQSYFQTDKNIYLDADKRGTWDNNFLGLVVAATISDQSKLWMQLETTTGESTRFTWFFLDYQISDALRAHVGRVKLPLGLYNEIIDSKFLHLSNLEPAIYQTAADFVHDAYHGVGLDFEQDVGGGHILWQAYAGNVYDVHPPEDSRDRRVFGGRVTYRTPVDGLRFMLSGYRTHVELLADHSLSNEDRVIGSVEYLNNNLDLKSEYATHKFMGVSSRGYYVQAGYTFADKWTPFIRYDNVTMDKSQSSNPAFYQKTIAVGVNYKLSNNISLRIENHFNRGYALPVASEETDPATASKKWNLFAVSANFAF